MKTFSTVAKYCLKYWNTREGLRKRSAALIRETRVNSRLSLKNGSEIWFVELSFVSRKGGREIEEGGKSEEGGIDGNTRGSTHCVYCEDARIRSKRMEMCDRKWETNCSNSILNLGHVSILRYTLSERKAFRGCARMFTFHFIGEEEEEGSWLLLLFLSPLLFFVLSDFRETMSRDCHSSMAITNWRERSEWNAWMKDREIFKE